MILLTAAPALLEKVEDDLVNSQRQIRLAAESDDFGLMRAASHILISVAGALGGVRLQNQSETLNRLATDEDAEQMRALAPEALRELAGLLEFIKGERARQG